MGTVFDRSAPHLGIGCQDIKQTNIPKPAVSVYIYINIQLYPQLYIDPEIVRGPNAMLPDYVFRPKSHGGRTGKKIPVEQEIHLNATFI